MDEKYRNSSINFTNLEDIEQSTKVQEKWSKKRIIFNLFIFSLCYFLAYTGFWALTNLQSTMNAKDAIGDYSQASIYVSSMLSSLFLPKLLIDKYGCKKVIVASNLVCCIYMASNCYLRWETMMTASIMFGLLYGPYLAAVSVYVDELAVRYQQYVVSNAEFVMASFFGIYTFFSENSEIWGNLISYSVLGAGNYRNNTLVNISQCGVRFTPRESENIANANLDPPTEGTRLLLVGIYVIFGILSVIIPALFLDPLGNDLNRESGIRQAWDRVLCSMRFLKNPHQLLLIPLSIFVGIEVPFYANEVTEAYVACAWGIHHVGFVTICYGISGAITSLLLGTMVKYTSIMAVILLGGCGNMAMCLLLYLWTPSPDDSYVFFVISSLHGFGDAIWWSQVPALYGLMFPDNREPAFSNLYFWSFLGTFLSYSYANRFSFVVKMNIVLAILFTGLAGYLIGQFKLRSSTKREDREMLHIKE